MQVNSLPKLRNANLYQGHTHEPIPQIKAFIGVE